jgi:hypothetical protein
MFVRLALVLVLAVCALVLAVWLATATQAQTARRLPAPMYAPNLPALASARGSV